LVTNFSFAFNDQIFYRAVNPTTITIDKVNTKSLNLNLLYTFFKYEKFHFALAGTLRSHLPYKKGPYEGGMGTGYTSSIVLSKKFAFADIKTSVFYSYDNLPQKEVDFERKEIGLTLGLTKAF
jgi:hypothetical protein